jgi:lysophospholipase L1-like esterase
MKRHFLFVLMASAVFTDGIYAADTSPPLKTRQKLLTGKPVRIVCFGDSVTGIYYHTGSRRAYTTMLGIALRKTNADANVEMINAGISGHTTVNALARIDKDVLRHKPDLVTVMFGLNDMTRVSVADYRANLKTIVGKCRDIGAEVVLATPNNVVSTSSRPTKKLMLYCKVVRDVGRELAVPVCDCYQQMDALRAANDFDWRLLMSDAIHPNMNGHKRIAEYLARTISGKQVSLADVRPLPAIARTVSLLNAGKRVRVLAMTPMNTLITPALKQLAPDASIEVTAWPTDGLSLADIEARAKSRVRNMKPDLVLIAVPRSAAAKSDEAFVKSYAWIMNWSLNFGPPTWDCVVVHPSVFDRDGVDASHDNLIRRLVRAQDLMLIDRASDNAKDASTILGDWVRQQRGDD